LIDLHTRCKGTEVRDSNPRTPTTRGTGTTYFGFLKIDLPIILNIRC
jgi:hypothetical protein